MGAWGTDVNENDVFADIYDSFYEIYNEGADPLEASQLVRQIHEYDFDDEDLSVDAYLALALCQWETGVLRPELLDRVKVIVEEGKDSPLWLEADAATRKDRSEKLSAFLAKISVPTSEPKKRQKRKIRLSTERPCQIGRTRRSKNVHGERVLCQRRVSKYDRNVDVGDRRRRHLFLSG